MKPAANRYVVCASNKGYPASLEIGKVYRVLPDADADRHGEMRVIDEEDDDYIYPRSFFETRQHPASLAMKKRTDRQPVAPSVLVVLRDGSCLWFPRAMVRAQSHRDPRAHRRQGVNVVVPAAGTGLPELTTRSEEGPEPIAQLVNAIDGLEGALLGVRSPKPHVDPQRLARICKAPHQATVAFWVRRA